MPSAPADRSAEINERAAWAGTMLGLESPVVIERTENFLRSALTAD